MELFSLLPIECLTNRIRSVHFTFITGSPSRF